MKSEGAKKIDKQVKDFANSNPLARILGNYLMQLCDQNEAVNQAILAMDSQNTQKRIDYVAKHITEYARKKATNNMAMLTDDEVFGETCSYLGIRRLVKGNFEFKPVEQQKKAAAEETGKYSDKKSQKQKQKLIEPVAGQENLFSLMGV